MKKPKYCNFCGSKLIEVEPKDSFDIYTGKKRMELSCPAYGKTAGRRIHFSVLWPRIKGWEY